ncbi:MAG: DUF4249 domain-containing protein [Cyclobacteriaceae bacterium]
MTNKGLHIALFFWGLVFTSCVQRIDFEVPPAADQIVIEGSISSDLEPCTVKISRGLNINTDSIVNQPVTNAKVVLFDDLGNAEGFTETIQGTYQTNREIQGEIGRSYHIEVELPNGNLFVSEPDTLRATGQINNIRYEYEARTVERYSETVAADVFNIYIDAKTSGQGESYVRWRFKGTYKAETNPELRTIVTPSYPVPLKSPLPCSGYIVVSFVPGGKLEMVDECTCCVCWVNHFEVSPQLSETQFVEAGKFNNIKVAEVPINVATFHDKYLVDVEQMSLSKNAYEFFSLVKDQKENAASLFQPPAGEIRGNIRAVNNNSQVIGLFYAASISKKSIFLQKSDVPYPLTAITFVTDECTNYYPDSFSEKPEEWD